MRRGGGRCKEVAFNGFNGRRFQNIEAEEKQSNDSAHSRGGGIEGHGQRLESCLHGARGG
jgi:hypothetical protein